MIKESGIYKILNIENGKFYIGSAVALNIRKNNHFSLLRYNKHFNQKLQASFNKYGEENFKFEIIEKCDKNNLINKEQYYVDILKPKLNLRTKIVNSPLGTKQSKKHKQKISNALTGRIRSEEHKKNLSLSHKNKPRPTRWKSICQYDKQGNFIRDWESVKEATNTYGIGVSKVLKGFRKTAFGYVWKYKNNQS